MQFNPGNGLGLVDEINDICHSDNNSYPLESKTRRLNSAVDRYVQLALEVNESFHFDDTKILVNGQQTLPIANADFKDGQGNVPFPSDFLSVRHIWVKDREGERYTEVFENKDPGINQFYGNERGTPTSFKLMGDSIVWDKVPDFTQEGAVRIELTRAANRFTPDMTDYEPGIPLIFHPWLCQHASLPYLIEQQKANKNDIGNAVANGELAIKYHLSNKNKTRIPRLRFRREDNR